MNIIIKVVIAVVIGALVMGILDYFGLLNHSINALLGFLAGLLFFFGYDTPRRV